MQINYDIPNLFPISISISNIPSFNCLSNFPYMNCRDLCFLLNDLILNLLIYISRCICAHYGRIKFLGKDLNYQRTFPRNLHVGSISSHCIHWLLTCKLCGHTNQIHFDKNSNYLTAFEWASSSSTSETFCRVWIERKNHQEAGYSILFFIKRVILTWIDFSSRNDVVFMTHMWKERCVMLSNLSH